MDETNQTNTVKKRKILLLGPSGAGKSSLCNALLNGSVDVGQLKRPAAVSSGASDCTTDIQIYDHDIIMVTDTIGFDNDLLEPVKLVDNLRRVIIDNRGYDKVILCFRLGRITKRSRIYFKLLDGLFQNPLKDQRSNVMVYISGCEDGTTSRDFLDENFHDEDLKTLLANIEFDNIITGSMLSHSENDRDVKMFLQLRVETLERITSRINRDTDAITLQPENRIWKTLKDNFFFKHLYDNYPEKLKKIFNIYDTKCLASEGKNDENEDECVEQRKILLLGPSGSGKSSLCNALLNGSVGLEQLKSPAAVSSSSSGCTRGIYIYDHDNLMVTDTIGFDDNRYEPEELVKNLRKVISNANLGYQRIIICFRLGRVSEASRIYLRLLDGLFEKSYTGKRPNVILYISGCEDGTTCEDFIDENTQDDDISNLFNTIEYSNMITGSLRVHMKQDSDEKMFLPLREETLEKITEKIRKNVGAIKLRPENEIWKSLKMYFRYLYERTPEKIKDVLKIWDGSSPDENDDESFVELSCSDVEENRGEMPEVKDWSFW